MSKVNGRAGPSPDYPVRWNYERAGLPVIIVRESKDWRMVRDPMGDEVWINQSQLAQRRTAITTDTGSIYREPRTDAGKVARFVAGAVVVLGDVWHCLVSHRSGRPQGLGPARASVGGGGVAGSPRKKLGYFRRLSPVPPRVNGPHDPGPDLPPRFPHAQERLQLRGVAGQRAWRRSAPGNAQLPIPPMLMLNRITEITLDGGVAKRGHIVAELDINPDLWFFKCHFPGDLR